MKRYKIQYGLAPARLRHLGMLILAILALPVAGCRRAGVLDEKERANHLVAKGYEMVDIGDYEAAATLFRKALDSDTAMARPHLDLALVLHDRQKDYLRAIYHYGRYLELRAGTEKDDMIRARMQQAERAFVASRVTVNGADGPTAMQLLEENNSLRLRIESLEKTVAVQEKELVDLRESERRRLRDQVITGGTVLSATVPPVADASGDGTNTVDRAAIEPVSPPPSVVAPVRPPLSTETVVRPVVPVTTPSVSPLSRAPVPVETIERTAVPVPPIQTMRLTPPPVDAGAVATTNELDEMPLKRTYTVQRGDTLSRIALKVYGDATLWQGIQEANRSVLGDSTYVRTGQLLVIP